MSEDKGFTEFVEYRYSANKNLVLQAKRRSTTEGPSGEVESLKNTIGLYKMGDLAERRKAPSISVTQKKPPPKVNEVFQYTPQTEETEVIYETLLDFIVSYVGDVPSSVLHEKASDLITIMKSSALDKVKYEQVVTLLGAVSEESFSRVLELCSRVSDYETKDEDTMEDDDVGMSLIFNDTEATEHIGYVSEEDIDETFIPKKNEFDEGYVEEVCEGCNVKCDYSKVYEVLSDRGLTINACENELIKLMEFNMKTVELVVSKRWEIVYSRLLKYSDVSEDEKRDIREMMMSNSRLSKILDKIDGKKGYVGVTKQLDLDTIMFNDDHVMTNVDCKLPSDTVRDKYKGYEEIHISPPPKPKHKINLISIDDIPLWAQKAFPKEIYKTLNVIQSRVYNSALFSDQNILVCAPTGAGKTNIAVLTILHEIRKYCTVDEHGEFRELNNTNFKVIYVAPMKALVQEVVGKFRGRLTETYGVQVGELTGDSTMTRHQIENTQVIVATPEKWDIVTRKSEDRTFVDNVKLLIIDEIHLLHDERGPVLESLISRTLRHQEKTQLKMRLLGVSATLPNYKDVGLLLRVKPETGLFYFDNSYRPVPLDQYYIGVSEKKTVKKLALMNEICYNKVMERADKDIQVIIFVHSRKETGKTAKYIKERAIEKETLYKFLENRGSSKQILEKVTEEVKNEELKELLPYGFGIHHAGMIREDRRLVEDLFADKRIRVLVSTATLAWGVNLPAHTVMIKGTQIYNAEKGKWTELSTLDIMQMMGRAGRPDFDKTGEGFLITTDQELLYYLSLLNQQLPIESQFIKKLTDNLNAEIVLGNLGTVGEAVNWLGYTYLYIRMMKNPEIYGVEQNEKKNDKALEQRRVNLIHTSALLLHKHGLTVYDKNFGILTPTDLGRIASHYYIPFSSISTYNKYLRSSLSDIDILRIFSLSDEFKFMIVRQEEKVELKKLYNIVPIPIKEAYDEPTSKVNILLQAYISKLSLRCFSLVSDLTYITQSACRIFRALFSIALSRNWSQLAVRCLKFSKMIEKRMWSSSQSPLRQFKGMSGRIIAQLEKKDISWERLFDLTVAQLGELIRFPQKGKDIYKRIHQFPKLDLTCHVQPITFDTLKFEMIIKADFQYVEKFHGPGQLFHIFVEGTNQEKILYYQQFLLAKRYSDEEHFLEFTVPIVENKFPVYFIRVISDRWIGSETVLPVFLQNMILPKEPTSSQITSLLQTPEIKVSDVIKNENFLKMFDGQEYFNQIQSQIFPSIFVSNNNLFIGIPPGFDMVRIIELAMLKVFSISPESESEEANVSKKCFYVCPIESKLKAMYTLWKSTFETILNKKVCILEGEQQYDFELISKHDIILSVPQYVDMFTMKWKIEKYSKLIKQIELFVVDDLHFITGEKFNVGHVMEIVISRVRFVSKFFEKAIRILCLSLPVECPRDVSNWIGSAKQQFFNFHPNIMNIEKPVIKGYSNVSFKARFLSMVRSVYLNFKELTSVYNGENKNNMERVILFCSSPQHCEKMSIELINYIRSELVEYKYLFNIDNFEKDYDEKFLRNISNELLRYSLSFGLTFYTDSLNEKEKLIVKELYRLGIIRILILDYSLIYSQLFSADNVYVLGTEYYKGKEHRYSNYSVFELFQIISHCCDAKSDTKGKVVIYTTKEKEMYYQKFLKRPLFIESQLDHYLGDHLNNEISIQLIQSPQNAMDYLTNTFFFKRLKKNCNYYNLHNVSSEHISEFLSELVESSINDIVLSKCVSKGDVEEEENSTLQPLNLGIISTKFYVYYSTIDLFNSSLTENIKKRGIIEILSASSEFDALPLRIREDVLLTKLSKFVPLKVSGSINDDSHDAVIKFKNNSQIKVNLLLQSHFSRINNLNSELLKDRKDIVVKLFPLIKSMINVLSTNNWLNPIIHCIELLQMIIAAVWDNNSQLLQLPHFTNDLIDAFGEGVESVFDLIEMDGDKRDPILKKYLNTDQMGELASFLNNYPNVDVDFEFLDNVDKFKPNDLIQVLVKFELEEEGEGEVEVSTKVNSNYYPKLKFNEWWVVIGDFEKNHCYTIKNLSLKKDKVINLKFNAPEKAGVYNLKLLFLSDSYTGCDQEYELSFTVV